MNSLAKDFAAARDTARLGGEFRSEGPGFVTPIERLGNALDRMIAIQMTAYPESWTDEEKREMAEQHLFGVQS